MIKISRYSFICFLLFYFFNINAQFKYESTFPYTYKKKVRYNREIELKTNDEKVMTFRRDSLIIGSNVYMVTKNRKIFYLINQNTKDTIGFFDKKWKVITIKEKSVYKKLESKCSGYNLIYADELGKVIAKARHARFEGVNEIRLECSDERITPFLFLSTLNSLKVQEKIEISKEVSLFASFIFILLY
jgi:hypothetical protein